MALSVGSPRLGVTQLPVLWSPDFPRLSNRGRLANSPAGRVALLRAMCGRYVINEDADLLARYFEIDRIVADPVASYNVAPTDEVYAVAEHRGHRLLGTFRWGLIPPWALDSKGPPNINARAETVATKPTFRDSLRYRRCILAASGFFEWGPKDEGRIPHYVTMSDGRPMALAGIWASWKNPETGERIRSCSIITTSANRAMAPVHSRMPVILESRRWDLWLDRGTTSAEAVQPLLKPIPSHQITLYPVTTLVNDVRNNLAENIASVSSPARADHPGNDPDTLAFG